MKTTSNVTVHTALRPSARVNFSDLDLGTFFTKNYAPGGPQDNHLFLVTRCFIAKSDRILQRSGTAICVGHVSASYDTASDRCFPRGVEVVDVEIVVLPQPGEGL